MGCSCCFYLEYNIFEINKNHKEDIKRRYARGLEELEIYIWEKLRENKIECQYLKQAMIIYWLI